MDPIYTFIVITLAILAIFDLVVGVANDAVNFLNSAIGSKIASRRVILSVAAIGIMIGTLTSSGMMEVARSGVFYPEQFSFPEIMVLFLGMIIGDILLLDLFNSLGLPTSTTVSMVFGLLGSAVGVSLHKIHESAALTTASIGGFINTSNALAIISAILLSVVLAFICGSLLMYLSRLLFSFRYKTMFKRLGAVWCGISFTCILYFAIFKGLKSSGLVPAAFTDWINSNTLLALAAIWALCSAILFIIQLLKGNILKITILAGTMALALAFAGNDLVNFIGVPLAGYDSYRLAQSAGSDAIMMGGLNAPVRANILILCAAGVIMVLTLFFNKKSMRVTQTELSLASQNESDERFGSSAIARSIVRAAVSTNAAIDKITPRRLREAIDSRFVPLPAAEREKTTYDLIRATVNLTAAALLISIATSHKLPLSTTYVVFMVAMGSSFADRAWGRESAVYRITGVFTVIIGWFVTALIAFTFAFALSSALIWGGKIVIIAVVILCIGVMLLSNLKKSKKDAPSTDETPQLIRADSSDDILYTCTEEVIKTMEQVNHIYNRTLVALFKENLRLLKTMTDESRTLVEQARKQKYDIISTLHKLQNRNINSGHFYVQVVDYLSEVTKALYHIVLPAKEHIANNHEGLSKAQIADLMRVNDAVEVMFARIEEMLRNKDFSQLDDVMTMRDNLFDLIAEVTKSQLVRINDDNDNTPAHANMLYLNILGETKTMVLQARNLIKSQRYFIEHKDDK